MLFFPSPFFSSSHSSLSNFSVTFSPLLSQQQLPSSLPSFLTISLLHLFPLFIYFPSPFISPLHLYPLFIHFPSPFISPPHSFPLSFYFPSPLFPVPIYFPPPFISPLHYSPSPFISSLLLFPLSIHFPSPFISPLLLFPLSISPNKPSLSSLLSSVSPFLYFLHSVSYFTSFSGNFLFPSFIFPPIFLLPPRSLTHIPPPSFPPGCGLSASPSASSPSPGASGCLACCRDSTLALFASPTWMG